MCGHDRGVDEDWDEDPDPGDVRTWTARQGRRRRRRGPGQGDRRHVQRRTAARATGDVPGRRSRPWSPAPTSSSRPAPGPESPWPTWCPPCSAARRWWWPPPPRPCRTSWPRRTCPRWSGGSVSAFTFAVLKGRSNYICRQRVAEVGSGGIQPELGDEAGSRTPSPTEPGDSARERPRGPGRRGAHPAELVRDHDEWRPGRPELRTQRAGVDHGQRRSAGVPGRLQLPLGQPVLRRGGPRPGGGGRRRGGQHPPLRRPPGQRAAPCCPSTRWSSSTRPTSSRR